MPFAEGWRLEGDPQSYDIPCPERASKFGVFNNSALGLVVDSMILNEAIPCRLGQLFFPCPLEETINILLGARHRRGHGQTSRSCFSHAL